ncbi:MAG: hypothetical protein H3Z50_00815 [archaeon]|nr:hypothetical protein [archaeon]MCP8306377.1 hypothetical protein [archaeon]
MSLDIIDLIEEEKRAEETIEDAKRKANKILEDAKRMAGEIVEKGQREKFFQDFIDKRTSEIDEDKKMIMKQFEDECENLAKKAEANLSKVVDFVLEKVLGVEYE